MLSLTCPVPNNINPLQSNGFMLKINKLPEISFFCQEANVPSIDLPAAVQASPLIEDSHPGDKVTFGDLNVTFLIDEDLVNYKAVYNWMMGLGFPKSHDQFANFINSQDPNTNLSVSAASVSDGVLQVLNSSNNPVASFMFRDMYPMSLSSLQLQSTTTETTYLAGQATFRFTLFEIE